ncbi:hypothetical protein Pcinc_010363 [Petrolisthes cinctipes]|uniref:Uncharacterized protein n=1 Tax=Petrolisthes cinctipes TaxID=88211 RepID=A0AAE1G375_PETCI|nr:hypothetical protein Pcinc_010363 [Petrolisthes cinctipes]
MKWVKRARGGREGVVTMRVERLQEEEYREEFKRVVERHLGRFDLEQLEEVNEVSRVLREEMCGACEEVCGVKRKGRGVKETAWWNEEVKRVIEEKKKAYREWLGSRENGEVEGQKRELYMEKREW